MNNIQRQIFMSYTQDALDELHEVLYYLQGAREKAQTTDDLAKINGYADKIIAVMTEIERDYHITPNSISTFSIKTMIKDERS